MNLIQIPSYKISKVQNNFCVGAVVMIIMTLYDMSAAFAQAKPSGVKAIEEVVVTARKREENLQDIPISITAFSGEGLEARGITKATDLANVTPNLTFQNSPGHSGSSSNAAVYIRGVGQQDFVPTVEPGVGIYVDGVYVARSLGAVLDIVDVERIQVLRGPQGTLFGRNTIGGAIELVTKKPADEFGGSVDVRLGTDNRQDVKSRLDVPLSDTLSSKISLATLNQDGYVKRNDGVDLGDDETITGRLTLRWAPTDDLDFIFSYDGTRERENGPAFTLNNITFGSAAYNPVDTNGNFDPAVIGAQIADTIANPNLPFFLQGINSLVPTDNFALLHNFVQVNAFGQTDCLTQIPGQPFDGGGNVNNPACYNSQFINGDTRDAGTAAAESRMDLDGYSLTAEWAVSDNLNIKSITAYRELDGMFARDGDHSPLPIVSLVDTYEQEQFTQELQFLGTAFDDALDWIIGLYYFEEEGENVNDVFFPPADVRSGGKFDNSSEAIFAQATYHVTDRWDLTLGIRYTDEEKSFSPDQFILADRTNLDADLDGVPDGVNAFGVGTRVLPFVTETIDISETTPLINLAYHWSDDLLLYGSYSEGFKSGGFTQRVFPPLPTVPSFQPEFVDVYELGFKYSGWDDRLRLNAAIFHSEYDDVQVSIFDPSGGNTAPVFTNAAEAEIDGLELELLLIPAEYWLIEYSLGWVDPEFTEVDARANEITTDSEFERVSDVTSSLAISRDFSLANDGWLNARIDISYRSDYFNDALNEPKIAQEDSLTLVNARLAWTSASEEWGVAIGGTNLGDENYTVSGLNNTTFDIQEVIRHRGREWYASAKYNF